MGELLAPHGNVLNPSNALLASDLTMKDDSACFWLRNPKINRESLGDMVEVWSVPERKDLDPITVLQGYLRRRQAVFGEAERYPLFCMREGPHTQRLNLIRTLIFCYQCTLS